MKTSRLSLCILLGSLTIPQLAQAEGEATMAFKTLTPAAALTVAQATLKSCSDAGYQVAVSVVDRAGIPQVMLRDRFAGPHTPETAERKAWTAVSFKQETSVLAEVVPQGEAWAISDGYNKVFACCQYGHATIEATKKLLEKAPVERVAAIHLETHEKARIMDNPDPETTIAGKFSIQHIAATSAVHASGGAEAFSSNSLHIPEVVSLRHRVSTSPFLPLPDWPNDRPTRVTWTLDDGSTLTEEVMSARGGPDLPFTPDEIRAKIHGIVGAPYPAMLAVVDALLDLDTMALSQPWDETVGGMTDA